MAWDVVTQEGAAALSMRTLAARLGVSYQVVYSRVGGKAEVAAAIHREGFRRLVAAAGRVSGEGGTQPRMIARAEAYVSFAEANPHVFDVMFGSPIAELHRDDALRAVEWAAFRGCFLEEAQLWLAAQGRSGASGMAGGAQASAVMLAYRLWTAVHGIAVVRLAGHAAPAGTVAEVLQAQVSAILAYA